MIFSAQLLDIIYKETKTLLDGVIINKEDLVEETNIFELTLKQIKNHPWQQLSVEKAQRDLQSVFYKNIQASYVGNDPEEDYKEVIVWLIAEMLYVTAAVDHDPTIPLKWDVVVYKNIN